MLYACNSVNGFITNDYEDKISYLSTKFAIDKQIALLLKQVAIRSLSCEVVPGKEGQIYFGDSIQGHILSHTFFLKDTHARGFHRWYSVVVFMKDKHFLINSWSFFEKHIKKLAGYLQDKAAQVFTNEESKMSQRALRLAQEQTEFDTRSLVKLTDTAVVFAKKLLFGFLLINGNRFRIHLWFAWLLSTGATRLEEQIPTREVEFDLEKKEVLEGLIIIEGIPNKRYELTENMVTEIRKLRRALGFLKFQYLLYSMLVGHQIVIRGSKEVVLHVINLLKYFLPKKKFRCLEYADCYKTPNICNIIGLNLFAAVPKPTFRISRLDIVHNAKADNVSSMYSSIDFDNYDLLLKTGFNTPTKWPTLLTKADTALEDISLSDKVVFLYVNSLMEEWMNLIGIIIKVKTNSRNMDVTGLLQCLNVLDQDLQLVEFWSS